MNWKIIPNTNNLYEASDCGQIRRVVSFVSNSKNGGKRKVGGKALSQKTKRNGYKEVQIFTSPQKGVSKYVHRLVFETFVGKIPKGMAINHIDGVKSNNKLSNLECVTYSENTKHAYSKNLINRFKKAKGESHPKSKMTKSDVLLYRDLHSKGATPTQISDYYGINKSTLSKALYRETWKHI